jgi:hypothetical protein
MKTEVIKATKKGRLLKHTYTSGINIGDYSYVLLDSKGNFIERIGNRTDLQPYLDNLN